MASHVLPVPEVHRSVTRPITMDIIREVLDLAGLKPNQFRTKMVGYADAETVPGSTLDEKDIPPNRLSSDEKLVMEIREEDVDMNITPVRYPNRNPIFHDTDLKIMMKPVLCLVKATVSVVITVPSRVRAHNWLMEIRRGIHQGKMTNYHTVDYHYPLPKPITFYLLQMHQMREAVEPLNESFGEWMKRCFVNRWTIVSNLGGHERLFAVQERQTNIHGWFNFDFEPEKAEKDSDNAGGWNIQFDYTFHYQRPDSIVFAHPLVIHNQMLPIEMINTVVPDHLETYDGYAGLMDTAYSNIVARGNKYGMWDSPGIPEPIFDDWFAKQEPLYHLQLCRTLTIVDPSDRRWALSLDDWSGNFEFKPEILRFMKDVKSKLVKEFYCVFHIKLHRWDSVIPGDQLEVDGNLKLSTKFDMKLTDMWHVVTYILTDPFKLHPDGWDDILKNCDVFHEWFAGIFGNKYANAIRCNTDNTVNRDDLDKVLEELKKQTNGGKDEPKVFIGLPQTAEKYQVGYTIIAKKNKKGE